VRYLTPEEEIKLRAEMENRWPGHMPELDLALHTGLRLSEIYGLDWQDVDLARSVAMTVRYSHLAPDFLLNVVEKLVPQPSAVASTEPTDTTTDTSVLSPVDLEPTHVQ
jgi:integrase